MNSKQKGKRGELEAARLLREYGYDTRRGVQYKGGEDSPDVVGLPYCHLEIKRVEKLNIHEAIEQAKRDKGPDELSVVMHRKNNCEWLVTMPFMDWIRIFREYEAGESMKHGADSIDAAGSVSSDDNIQPLEVGDDGQK